MIEIYDSLTGRKQPLPMREPDAVGLYVCGITVYDYCHLGHARAMVVFDMAVRYLRAQGIAVRYVRNVTDIDDKIINRAVEAGERAQAIADYFTAAMRADEAALGLTPPDVEPKATEHVDQIVTMIERLIARGYAYAGDNGDVYYDVSRFANYGALSGRSVDELRAGARVGIDEAKHDAVDFALWKAAKPREPSWPSPWGRGRPGWHIECSVMSTCCLGESFDIHGGGLDLKFPHHENEIAQSEGATGKRYASLWMHNGFVTVDHEKMSKSLGNFWTVRDVLAEFDAESVRYFVLASHYRSPLAYTRDALAAAQSALARLYTALRDAPAGAETELASQAAVPFVRRFNAAMADDLNTPAAIAVLFELARASNRADQTAAAAALTRALRDCGRAIGLLQQPPTQYLQGRSATNGENASAASAVEAQLEQRRKARADKDFATADAIRAKLAAEGIVIEDGANGTSWRRR